MDDKVAQIEQILTELKARFNPEATKDVQATIVFNITDIPNGSWVVTVDKGTCKVERTRLREPTAGMTAKADDLVKFFNGQISQTAAVVSGKVKVLGSMSALSRMEKWFDG